MFFSLMNADKKRGLSQKGKKPKLFLRVSLPRRQAGVHESVKICENNYFFQK